MPIYDFKCRGCGEQFEALVRHNSTAACPKCNGADLEQLISLFAVDSEGVRQSNIKSARRQNAKVQKEKAIADHESLHHHHDH